MVTWFTWFQAALLGARLWPCLAAAAVDPSHVSVEDLLAHLEVLEGAARPPPRDEARASFERGLTYQLLAARPGGDVRLGREDLLRRAEESYRRCLASDADHVDALSNLATLLSDDNHNAGTGDDAAIIAEMYERALRRDPAHRQGHVNYGLFLRRRLGRHATAADVFERGLLRHPTSATLRFEWAFTKELLGETAQAAATYESLTADHPNYTSAWLNLAAIYHKRLLVEDAIGMYATALSTITSYPRECFRRVQAADDLFVRVRSPLIDYTHNNAETCVCPSAEDTTLVCKILSNQGLAAHQRGWYVEALQYFQEVLALLLACAERDAPTTAARALAASVDLFLSAKAGCFFSAWDWIGSLLSRVEASHLVSIRGA